jgi:hypothetical protein
MADAAQNLLATLTPEQRAKASFEFSSDERVNFHFVPMPRKGLPMAEMTPEQKHLAHILLNSPLSHRGYFKAATIMSLERILFEMEKENPRRNPEMYYVSLFGTPGKDVWGVRIEGHHLTLNFTARGDQILATTPSFLGTNPAEVRTGPRTGLRVLKDEEELGRTLLGSLDEKQRALTIVTNVAPKDIITGDSRHAALLLPLGISAEQLNKAQRVTLKRLVMEYIGRNRTELAEADWKKFEAAGWNKIHFAWAGSTEPGQGHYYRIQSPDFLFEYDNTQNEANHVHAVWRDFNNDFGDDLLKQHYQSAHTKIAVP